MGEAWGNGMNEETEECERRGLRWGMGGAISVTRRKREKGETAEKGWEEKRKRGGKKGKREGERKKKRRRREGEKGREKEEEREGRKNGRR